MYKKVAVIGGGNVGASVVHYLSQIVEGEVVLLDVVPHLPRRKAKDFNMARPLSLYKAQVTGSEDFSSLKDADVVVHTAGIARKPGMDRMDLLKINIKIAKDVSKHIVEYAPNAILIVVANPLDVIATVCYQETKFPKQRVIGMAGVLDSARYRYFISENLHMAPSQARTMVLGGHGDTMVPITQYSSVNGMPVRNFISQEAIERMEKRTCTGGGEIVKHLKTGSAYYAPAASAANMVEAVILGERRILPASVFLQGEYGVENMFLGVPALLGKAGVERIIELPLDKEQSIALNESIKMVKTGLEQISTL